MSASILALILASVAAKLFFVTVVSGASTESSAGFSGAGRVYGRLDASRYTGRERSVVNCKPKS